MSTVGNQSPGKVITGADVDPSASLSIAGLTLNALGARVTGDFTNATVANRVMFQTSTTNGNTNVGIVPNGTGINSNFYAYNSSDPNNAAYLRLAGGANSSLENRLESGITGTGTYLPMTFYTGGSERMRIGTDGLIAIWNNAATALNAANGSTNVAIGNGSGNGGITIYTGTAGTGAIAFADGTTTTDTYRGYLSYQHSVDAMLFYTAATERMRIDSSGNVGIGGAPGALFDVIATSPVIRASTSANNYSYFRLNTWGLDRAQIRAEAANPGAGSGTGSGLMSFWVAQNPTMTEVLRIDGGANTLHVNATGGLGYGTGAGGTVTQGTSKSTGVTINKPTGKITMHNAALNASTTVTFQVTNSVFNGATDTVVLCLENGSYATLGTYQIWAEQGAVGSFAISVRNISAGSLSEALAMHFTIIKGAVS